MAVKKPWDLEGWEAIGKALGRDERTARRWEKRSRETADPMPVMRPGHMQEVVAVEADLEAWLARQLPAEGENDAA